jgi:hypothetical protein
MKKKIAFLRLLIVSSIVVISMLLSSQGVLADSKDIIPVFDDFNRPELGVTGEGGGYNEPNSAGIPIYWIQMRNVTATIENNALKLSMKKEAWFGEGLAFKDPTYKYIIMKMKGEKGGEEKFLTLNPDAKGLKKFTELKGLDGKPIPKITKEYQNIVIDIAKSGFNLPRGFEAIHFNNTGELTVYIDEIYLSKDGVPLDLSKALAAATAKAAVDDNEAATEDSSAVISSSSDSLSNADDSENEAVIASTVSSSRNPDKASDTTESFSSKRSLLVAIIILIMALLIGVVIYNSFFRKPK